LHIAELVVEIVLHLFRDWKRSVGKKERVYCP